MKILRGLFLAFAAALLLTTAYAQPIIIQNPSNATNGTGGITAFSVSATGSGALAYQWLKVGTNMTNGTFAGRATVSGATTSTLTLSNLTTSDQSAYSCRITDTSGTVTSSVATLTILVAPSWTVQPITRITNAGSNVTFSAQALGIPSPSYQWFQNGSLLAGATLNTYTINNAQTNFSGNYYSLIASNSAGQTPSTNAFLWVGITPAITVPPTNLTVIQGQSASLITVATGWPLNYYWRKSGVLIGTNSSLTFPSVVASNAGSYTCQVSNFLGSLGTAAVGLTVQFPPTITTNPLSQTVAVASNFTLTVIASGVPALSYQWRFGGAAITSATTSSYSVTNSQPTNAGNYDVVLTNSVGAVTSSVAIITISNYPPMVTNQLVGGNVLVGSNFTMTAVAIGSPPLNWQWRFGGTPIPGATSSSYPSNSYTLGPAQLTDAGSYDVVVTNIAGSATSSVATVNVGYAPVVVQQPLQPPTNSLGGTASFSCTITGSLPMSLQWTLNGYPIANQTNASLTLTNLQATNIGFYALAATNLFGNAISSNAQVNLAGYNFSQWAGLEAYFALNGDATDSSGYGNHGTNFGAVAATDRFGNINGAMSFNGTSAYIRCKSGAYFSSNYTVAAWVNATAYNNNSRILDFGNGGPLNNTDLILSTGTTGHPDFDAWIGTIQVGICSCTNAIPSNQWVYVVGTCNAANTSIYFNGILQRLVIGSINRPFTNTVFNYIGKSNFSGDLLYAGRFDDIRIFNRSLSSNEVAQLYAIESQTTLTPQQHISASFSNGSTLSLNLSGQPGSTYILQTATNLVSPIQWQSIATNTADGNGACPFTDSTPIGPRKFYRAITAP